jgi:hypothetical protein
MKIPHDILDAFGVDNPLLYRATQDETFFETLTSMEIEQLAQEILRVLLRCSVPESTLSNEERLKNAWAMYSVTRVDSCLEEIDDDDETMLQLFRETIATPNNLEALLCMTNPSIRTGLVRDCALELLSKLAKVDTIWNLRMNNGSVFSSCLIGAGASFRLAGSNEPEKASNVHIKQC